MRYLGQNSLFVLPLKGQVVLESIIAIVVFLALVAGVFSFFSWYKKDMEKREVAFRNTRAFKGITPPSEDFYNSTPANII